MINRKLSHYGLLLVTTALTISASALTLPTLPASPTIPTRTVTLNAPHDGVTDATSAINNAIAQLSNEGGGTLQFEAGTYLVKVNSAAPDFVLQFQNSVRLLGDADGTTIKLANKQPPYNTIVGTGSAVHDVEIENITIDLNGENNPITSTASRLAGIRSAIRVDQGPRVKISGCTVLNVADVNTFLFSGTVTDVEVANNTFPNVGQPPGSLDFDHSTIYTNGQRMWVHDNTFTAAHGPGTPDARTAIETHGNDQTVTQNTINGYSIGMMITGQAVSSNRQLYNNNILENIISGMEIRSFVYIENSTQSLDNITIENNQINLSPTVWRNSGLVGTGQPAWGIFIFPAPTRPAPINGLSILNNTITFPATQGAPVSGDTYSGGVVLWSYSGPMTPISNLTITGNTITNALGPAIWSNMALDGGATIASNTIVNPARSSGASQQTAVYISDNTKSVNVQSNAVSDTARPPKVSVGISAVSTCQSSCTASGNTVTPTTIKNSVLGAGWKN